MPYDPDTFKNLYPFPDRSKIRQSFEDFCRENPQELPKEFRTNSRVWIDEQTKQTYNHERQLFNESQKEADKAWQKHQEKEHSFENLPESLKQKIHSRIWEDNHSGGYTDMRNQYIDLVPLVVEAYELGKKSMEPSCNCGQETLIDSKRYNGPRGNHTRVAGEDCSPRSKPKQNT